MPERPTVHEVDEAKAVAFREALALGRRVRSRRWLVMAIGFFAVGVGGTTFRRMSKRRDALDASAAAWSEFSRCLAGSPLEPVEKLETRLLRMELSLPEAAGATEKGDWPSRCAPFANQVHRVISQSDLAQQAGYADLDDLAARAAKVVTWGLELPLLDELWSAARSLGLAVDDRDPRAPPPAHPLTAANLSPLPVPSGAHGEAHDSLDPSKLVVQFSTTPGPTSTLCTFGAGRGVVSDKRLLLQGWVRTTTEHFDRFELVRPRIDGEPRIDALPPGTRAAEIFGDELVYVVPGPNDPDVVFARSAREEGDLGEPANLGEIRGRAHEFAACRTADALVIRIRSYDAHLAGHESWAKMAFFADGAWTTAPKEVVAGNVARLTCRSREGTLTWLDDDIVHETRCTKDDCAEVTSGPLERAWAHLSPLAAADLDGKVLLLGTTHGAGPLSASLVHSVRMRIAPIDQIARAPDVVLWGDSRHEGADPSEARLFVGQGAAEVIVTTVDGANRAIRVDAGGEFASVAQGESR
jgi:hypothetical protein